MGRTTTRPSDRLKPSRARLVSSSSNGSSAGRIRRLVGAAPLAPPTGRCRPRGSAAWYRGRTNPCPAHMHDILFARSRPSAPGPPPRARSAPAQTGGGDGDPPGRGVRCPGHPPPLESRPGESRSILFSPAGVSPAGGPVSLLRPGAGRPRAPVSPAARLAGGYR